MTPEEQAEFDRITAENAKLTTEKAALTSKNDQVLGEKKKLSELKSEVVKITGISEEEAKQLSAADLTAKLTKFIEDTKKTASSANDKTDVTAEQLATALQKIETIETEQKTAQQQSIEDKAKAALKEKESELTKELAGQFKISGSALTDAVALAVSSTTGKTVENYGEFVKEFVKDRQYLIPVASRGGSDDVGALSEDDKKSIDAIKAKRKAGASISRAELRKIQSTY